MSLICNEFDAEWVGPKPTSTSQTSWLEHFMMVWKHLNWYIIIPVQYGQYDNTHYYNTHYSYVHVLRSNDYKPAGKPISMGKRQTSMAQVSMKSQTMSPVSLTEKDDTVSCLHTDLQYSCLEPDENRSLIQWYRSLKNFQETGPIEFSER